MYGNVLQHWLFLVPKSMSAFPLTLSVGTCISPVRLVPAGPGRTLTKAHKNTHTLIHTLKHTEQHEQAYIKDTSVSNACLMGQAGSGWPQLQVTAQINTHDYFYTKIWMRRYSTDIWKETWLCFKWQMALEKHKKTGRFASVALIMMMTKM